MSLLTSFSRLDIWSHSRRFSRRECNKSASARSTRCRNELVSALRRETSAFPWRSHRSNCILQTNAQIKLQIEAFQGRTLLLWFLAPVSASQHWSVSDQTNALTLSSSSPIWVLRFDCFSWQLRACSRTRVVSFFRVRVGVWKTVPIAMLGRHRVDQPEIEIFIRVPKDETFPGIVSICKHFELKTCLIRVSSIRFGSFFRDSLRCLKLNFSHALMLAL